MKGKGLVMHNSVNLKKSIPVSIWVCIIILLWAVSAFSQNGDPAIHIRWQDPQGNPAPKWRINNREALRALMPPLCDTSIATRPQIEDIAEKNGLLRKRVTNLFMVFDSGDIGFFENANKSVCEIEIEFLARGILLHDAEENKIFLPNKGDFAFFANKLAVEIYRFGLQEVW